MADTPQARAPEKPTPRGNIIAMCVMVALGAIFGTLELTHGSDNHAAQQQATSHHSLHSSTTGSAQ